MTLKLKAIGAGLLSLAALGTLSLATASATVSGHFVNDALNGHAMVNQTSSGAATHKLVIRIDETAPIVCEQFSAFGTVTSATVTEVEGTTSFKNCRTEGSETAMAIHTNGCVGKGWSNKAGAITGGMACPGSPMLVTHPNCNISVPPQSGVSGFTPTSITTNGKHAITLDVNIQYTVHYEAGICIFLGTKHTAFVTGSTIIQGTDTNGEAINITST